MKRGGPLKRSPLARGTSQLQRSRMKRGRPGKQPPERRDDAYLAWVRGGYCVVGGGASFACSPVMHAHHSRSGAGTGQKAHDHRALGICTSHHSELHALSGFFKGWTRERLRAFENAEIERLRALYEKTKGTA